jgi:hypothetical protein
LAATAIAPASTGMVRKIRQHLSLHMQFSIH